MEEAKQKQQKKLINIQEGNRKKLSLFNLEKVTSNQGQGCLGSTKEGRCQTEKSVEKAGSKQCVWNV